MSDATELYSLITDGTPSVLLIDDDANILETARDILEDAKYKVSTASNGKEALKLLETSLFNVVIVDFQLPDSTGLELARKVRERSEFTCVILMTGHASLEMAVKAIQEAVYDYLIKPVAPAQLQRTIEKAIEKQTLVLENKRLLKDLQDTNEAMARLDGLKSKMLTILSHDLRTPLASIRGYSDLLRSGVKGKLSEAQKKMVEITIQEADHLNGLINDLLDLASIETGRLNVDLRTIPFGAVVNKAIQRVKLVAEMKEVPLDVSMTEPLPLIEGDNPRLVQVIANLLRGALKQTVRGGRIYVKVLEKGEDVELKVTFSGQGFSEDHLRTIFEWKRAPGEPQSAKDGLRIGLAIAREILHAHQGEIGVESLGPEEGATFWFRVPKSKNKTVEHNN